MGQAGGDDPGAVQGERAGILPGAQQRSEHLDAMVGEAGVELVQVADQVGSRVSGGTRVRQWTDRPGDGRGHQVGLVPVATVDGGPGDPGLGGDPLHGHPGVADLGQLVEGRQVDGLAGPGVAGTARCPPDLGALVCRRRARRGGRGRRTVGAHATTGLASGAPGPTGSPAGWLGGTGGPLTTKSRWRMRAKAATEPMKAMIAPIAIRWSRVEAKPTW